MKKLILCAIVAICGFTTANAQAKFGHVNTQEIMQALPDRGRGGRPSAAVPRYILASTGGLPRRRGNRT